MCYRLADGFPHEMLQHCLRDLLAISTEARGSGHGRACIQRAVWVGRSLREGFFMFWDTLLPLCSASACPGVQAFVSHEQMDRSWATTPGGGGPGQGAGHGVVVVLMRSVGDGRVALDMAVALRPKSGRQARTELDVLVRSGLGSGYSAAAAHEAVCGGPKVH